MGKTFKDHRDFRRNERDNNDYRRQLRELEVDDVDDWHEYLAEPDDNEIVDIWDDDFYRDNE